MDTLHITNGDGAARVIQNGGLAGDVLPWRDPMHHGPFPQGLSLAELAPLRAKHLAGHGLTIAEVAQDFHARDRKLLEGLNGPSIVLWFEHDLLDQLQLLQLLDWFADRSLGQTQLEIICINQFAGMPNFRGLGELSPEQLSSLYPHRRIVTASMLSAGKAGWAAFCAPSPNALMNYIDSDLTELPFMRAALLRHLQDYPSTQTGLSQTEHQILTLVAQGVQDPQGIFLQNMDFETALYLGDWRTFNVVKELCQLSLLDCDPKGFWYQATTAKAREKVNAQRLSLTGLGKDVLEGNAKYADLFDRSMWLGGVEFRKKHPQWTWCSDRQMVKLHHP